MMFNKKNYIFDYIIFIIRKKQFLKINYKKNQQKILFHIQTRNLFSIIILLSIARKIKK
jgi:hypothetical protein